jgi:TonB family protein
MPGWNESLLFSVAVGLGVKSTAVLGVAWLIAFLLRRRSAAARHLVWTAAAAAVLALPLLTLSLPALSLPAVSDTGPLFEATGTASSGITAAATTVLNGPAPVQRAESWKPDVRLIFALVWALGTTLVWVHMIVGYRAMSRARRATKRPRAIEGIPVLETADGGMPMSFGVLHPVIFMPADSPDWPEDRRRMVLLHELAHIRRGDTATHLLARAALGLNWWNPLAWIGWREFLKERERAADDLVLNAGERASEYAGHLLEIARSMQSARPTAWAAVAMARRSQIEGRLLAILDSGVNRKEAGKAAVAVAAAIAVALIAPFAALRAQGPQPPDVQVTLRAADAQNNYEMLDQAAKAYERLRDYDSAQSLLDAALAIRGRVSGDQSAAYAAGLVNLGDLNVKRPRALNQAESYYLKAVALGDRPEVAPALLFLGRLAYGRNNLEAADYLQRAINVAPGGPQAGPATAWLGVVRQSQPGGASEAESLYQRALTMEGDDSPDAAMTMDLYARFLRSRQRDPEAEQFESRARQIRGHALTGNKPAASSPEVLRAGGGVVAPRLLHKVEPSYTEDARALKVAGPVILYVEIQPDGRAHNIQVKQGLGLGLDESAIDAISQWMFQPGTKGGQPVTVAATIEVNFRLM